MNRANKMTRLIHLISLPCLMFGLLSAGCGGDGGAGAAPAASRMWDPTVDPGDNGRVRVLVSGPNSEMRSIFIPPIVPGTVGKHAESCRRGGVPRSKAQSFPGLRTTYEVQVGTAQVQPGWYLLAAAAAECGVHPGNSLRSAIAIDPIVPPWYDAWFVFPSAPRSCDEGTLLMETLACVADKLEAVAETSVPIRWTGVNQLSESFKQSSGIPSGDWLIPPQSPESKAAIRDLSRNVMAHVAALEAQSPNCIGWYESAASGSLPSDQLVAVFGAPAGGTPAYPGPKILMQPSAGLVSEPVTEDSLERMAAMAEHRIAVRTHALRATGSLLKANVQTAFRTDLGVAELHRARSMDVAESSRAAWGVNRDGAVQLDSSYAHAIKTIAGRLELNDEGAIMADPACGGVAATEIIKKANGPATSSRWESPSVTTPGQREAACAIGDLGIVVPDPDLSVVPDGNGGFVSNPSAALDALRSAVQEQAVARRAEILNIPLDDFKAGPEADRVRQPFNELAEADLRQALRANRHAYALLTGANLEGMTQAECGEGANGLKCATNQASELTGLQGVALKGGIPRADLVGPVFARASGAVGAAQCGIWDAFTVEDGIRADTTLAPVAFQDAFSLAQTIAKSLVRVREMALVTESESLRSSVLDVARAGIAEVDAWSGRLEVAARMTADPETEMVASVDVLLAGLTPDDYMNASDPGSQFVAYFGTADVAECIAGQRTSCKTSYETFRSRTATSTFTDLTSRPDLRQQYGHDGGLLKLTFNASEIVDGEAIPSGGDSSGRRLFVIQKHDPERGGTRGRVLAALEYRAYSVVAAPASQAQRDMLDEAVGVPRSYGRSGCGIGEPGPSKSKSYCVEGLDRDQFVPLENEITSNGDNIENSWRHYLEMAEAAAKHADALGEQMIQEGLRNDLRAEEAQEELAELCGSYTAAESLKFDKYGRIALPPEGDPIQTCMGEKKHSIVYLAAMPLYGDSPDFLKEFVLGCVDENGQSQGLPGASNPLCQLNSFDDVTSLDLAPWAGEAAPPAGQCRSQAMGVGTLATGFQYYGGLPTQTSDELHSAAVRLQVVVDNDFNWMVKRDGIPVMSSDSQSELFPGCLAEGASCREERLDEIVDYTLAFRSPDMYTRTQWQPMIGINNEPGCNQGELKVSYGPQKDASSYDRPVVYCIKPLAGMEGQHILWRVQGAAWMMGSMGGWIPPGMFVMPIPVVDFNDASWESGMSTLYTPIATVFLGGELINGPSGKVLDSTVTNQQLLGRLFPITTIGWGDSSDEIPRFLRAPYARLYASGQNNGSSYFHAMGTFNGRLTGEPYKYTPSQLSGYLANLGGLQCAKTFIGPVTGGVANDSWKEIAKLKEWVNGDQQPTFGCFVTNYFGEDDGSAYNPYSGKRAADGIESYKVCQQSASYNGIALKVWGRDDRVSWFVNSYPPPDACSAVSQYAGAATLACRFRGTGFGSARVTAAPEIEGIEDMYKLEMWVLGEAMRARAILSRLYLEQVPTRVVHDIRLGLVGSGAKDGEHGRLVAEMEPAIRQIVAGWTRIEAELASLALAIRAARSRLDIVGLQAKTDELKLTLAQVQLAAAVAGRSSDAMTGLGGALVGTASLNPSAVWNASMGASNATEQQDYLEEQQAITAELQNLQAKIGSEQMILAVSELGTATAERYASLQDALTQVWNATSLVLEKASELRQVERKAHMAAAKALGAPYVMVDGKPVTIPVNAVYDRQYSRTKRRYEEALKTAKASAYMARLAIEQRFGRRLDTITTPVGPLDAPSIWADEICTSNGMSYETLSKVVVSSEQKAPIDDGSGPYGLNVSLDRTFVAAVLLDSTPYIGDYVEKLKSFVEFYNAENPFHEGDDTVVLSLRDDIVPNSMTCMSPGPNLLYFSGNLDRSEMTTGGSVIGWTQPSCPGTGTCVEAWDQAALPGLGTEPPDGARGHGVWLRDVAASSWVTPGGVVGDPKGVSQTVELSGATWYALSWYDQARTADGGVPGTSATLPQYSVSVTGPNGESVDAITLPPTIPDASTDADRARQFSKRNERRFKTDQAGTYTVTFSPSVHPATAPGSLVIANAQLERIETQADTLDAYTATSNTLLVSGKCSKANAVDLRNAFERRKASDGSWYYELTSPIVIEPALLEQDSSYLRGKFARGNYNLRHISVAVNLVGTGLIDCESTGLSSCYGSGVLRYTLEHNAFQAKVVSGVWNGKLEQQTFNFGEAGLFRAQALAAERFITTPISSADQALLSQPGIEKLEFMGRPVGGTYQLRIWDQPELAWDHLEDVQIVLKYRYWSPVKPSP